MRLRIFTTIFLVSVFTILMNAQTLTFDGVDDYIEVPKVGTGILNDFSTPHDFTIEIRFKLNAIPTGNGSLVSKHSEPADGFFMEFPAGTTTLKAGMGYNNNYTTNAGSTLTLDIWYNAAFVYNQTTNAFKFYIDGILINSEIVLPSAYFPETDYAIAIGKSLRWESPTAITIDFFRAWDTQRTTAELFANKDIEVDCGTANLLLQYDFAVGNIVNNNNIVTVDDCVSNSYDGTLFNFDSTVNTNSINESTIEITGFPNPITDYVTLQIEGVQVPSVFAEVFDINGKRLATHQLEVQSARIDFSIYAPGTYFIKVQTNEASEVLRVVKL